MGRKNVLYARLSVSDIDREDGCSSDSIDNQISYIKEYCERRNIQIDDYYVDDGYSGSNFERAQFRRLICDIEKNLIDLILVKDISRLGRNFIDVSYYINQYFPSRGVCLISINDNYDSSNMEDAYMESILNIKSFVNEKYIKDVSKKIKQVKLQKTMEKNYLGVVAPYGYVRVVRNGINTLDVDRNVCGVIKRIFLDVSCGKTLSNVASDLNKNNIKAPSVYMGTCKKASKWTDVMIYRIVRNVIYCGKMFYRKSEKSDYKKKKREHICLCDRKVINDTHPAIVSQELFEVANRKIRSNSKKVRCSYESLFLGKIYCGICGRSYMLSKKERSCGRVQYFFYCPNYRCCCNRTVSERKLKNQVFNVLESVVLKNFDVNKVVTAMVEEKCCGREIEDKIRKMKEYVSHSSLVLQELYLKLASEKINALEFKREKKRLSSQKENCLRELEVLQNENFWSIYEEKLRREFYKFIGDSNFVEKYFNYFVDKIVISKNGRVEIKFLLSNRQQMETEII